MVIRDRRTFAPDDGNTPPAGGAGGGQLGLTDGDNVPSFLNDFMRAEFDNPQPEPTPSPPPPPPAAAQQQPTLPLQQPQQTTTPTPAQGQPEPTPTPTPAPQPVVQPQDVLSRNDLRPDSHGNLVDRTGQVVVRTGPERRLYHRARAAIDENASLRSENQRLAAENNTLTESSRAHGLSNDEATFGLTFASGFKRDPANTIRSLMQIALARGVTLENIFGNDIPNGVNRVQLDAISTMIDQRLARFTPQQPQQNNEVDARARQEYNHFLASHPHAATHEAVLAQLVRDNPGQSPSALYWQLAAWCAENDYDISAPLPPQIAARQQQVQPQQVQQPVVTVPAPQPSAPPMPQGTAPIPQQVRPQTAVSTHDMSIEDIIRGAMAEAGITGAF